MGIVSTYPEFHGLRELGLAAVPASSEEVVAARTEEALTRNPSATALRWIGREGEIGPEGVGAEFGAEGLGPDISRSRLLPIAEANERFGIAGHLQFDRDVPEAIAEELYDLKRAELYRRSVLARAQGGFWEGAAGFAAELAVTAIDPLNIASAFVPAVGPARYALWLARAEGAAGRAAVRAGVGAAEGVVGAALVEPIVYAGALSEQADYGAVDSLLNLAFGGVLGGGLHTAFGAIGDRITGRYARAVDALPAETQREALAAAVAQVAEGRPVTAADLFRAELLSSTAVGRSLSREAAAVLPEVAGLPPERFVPRYAAGDFAGGQLRVADDIRPFFETHVAGQPKGAAVPLVRFDLGDLDPAVAERLAALAPAFGQVPARVEIGARVLKHIEERRPGQAAALIADILDIALRPDKIWPNPTRPEDPWARPWLVKEIGRGTATIVEVRANGSGIDVVNVIAPIGANQRQKAAQLLEGMGPEGRKLTEVRYSPHPQDAAAPPPASDFPGLGPAGNIGDPARRAKALADLRRTISDLVHRQRVIPSDDASGIRAAETLIARRQEPAPKPGAEGPSPELAAAEAQAAEAAARVQAEIAAGRLPESAVDEIKAADDAIAVAAKRRKAFEAAADCLIANKQGLT